MKNPRALLFRLAILAAACSAAFATYTYYYTDNLSSVNTPTGLKMEP